MKRTSGTDKKGVLDAVTNRTKVIALITLVAEALFVIAAYAIPEAQRLSAFFGCVAVLGVALLGCIWLEHGASASSPSLRSEPQPPKYLPLGDRVEKILGRWTGDALQDEGPAAKPFPAKVEFTFAVEPPTSVTGQGSFRGHLDRREVNTQFRFHGGFLYAQFLRFEYDPVETGTVQFGSIVLKLSSTGNKLTGRFHGYGATSERIVHGTLDLNKVV